MATVAVNNSSGSAYALLEQTWRPRLATQANDEMRICDTFDDGNEGVEKFAGTLNIRKIARIPSTTVLSTTTDVVTPTYTANTELNITVVPQMAYGAVQLSQATMNRLLAFPELQKAYRKQLMAGLSTAIDVAGASLVSALTTTIRGSGAQTFDKSFLLDGIGALIEQAKDLYQPGIVGWAYLHYHPRQYKYIHAINEIVNAQIRGDGEQVIKKGWTWDAYGLKLAETGNVLNSAGVMHNLLHVRESHVLAYNVRPMMKPPQDFDFSQKILSFAEFGVAKVWDEYAADMQTTNAA